MESTSCTYLKLLDRLPLGVLRLSHFVTNPTKAPDYLYRHECRFRTFAQGDFETTRWTVTRAVSAEVAAWRGHDRDAPVDNLLILSDLEGNILMQDYRPEAEATKFIGEVLTAIQPFQNALLTALRWIGSDHAAIEQACRDGLIYQIGHDLELGL